MPSLTIKFEGNLSELTHILKRLMGFTAADEEEGKSPLDIIASVRDTFTLFSQYAKDQEIKRALEIGAQFIDLMLEGKDLPEDEFNKRLLDFVTGNGDESELPY